MNDKYFSNDIINCFNKVHKKTGYDDVFLNSARFHLEALRDSKEADALESREEMYCIAFSRFFIDKMELYPIQHFECQVDENFDWPLEPLPSEFFGEKAEDDIRRRFFYMSMNVYDVLDCSVKSGSMPTYKLRVIHKYGVTRILDDLELTVLFSPTKIEVQLLERELLHNDRIRVAVSKIDKDKKTDEITIHVTIDREKIAHFRALPKLGRITEEDLPAYVLDHPDTEKYSNYSDYLNSNSEFSNSRFYDDLISGFGIDPKRVCSYYPKFLDSKSYPDGLALLNESKLDDAKAAAKKALSFKVHKVYDGSISCIDKSLAMCPATDEMLGRLYDIKSDINYEQEKTSLANRDLERAFQLKQDDEDIKKKMLLKTFRAAFYQYRKQRNYKDALRGFEFVLRHDPQNSAAKRLVNQIKTKYADQLVNLEEIGLCDLQEKKKKIISKLKKMTT